MIGVNMNQSYRVLATCLVVSGIAMAMGKKEKNAKSPRLSSHRSIQAEETASKGKQ